MRQFHPDRNTLSNRAATVGPEPAGGGFGVATAFVLVALTIALFGIRNSCADPGASLADTSLRPVNPCTVPVDSDGPVWTSLRFPENEIQPSKPYPGSADARETKIY